MKTQKENISTNFLHLQNKFELLSKNQARKLLRLSYDSINKLIKIGYIKIIKINTRERIPLVCLKEFLNSIFDNTNNTKQVDALERNPEFILQELINKYK
jgi:N-dimethylarginine dimethylaminohydrolase